MAADPPDPQNRRPPRQAPAAVPGPRHQTNGVPQRLAPYGRAGLLKGPAPPSAPWSNPASQPATKHPATGETGPGNAQNTVICVSPPALPIEHSPVPIRPAAWPPGPTLLSVTVLLLGSWAPGSGAVRAIAGGMARSGPGMRAPAPAGRACPAVGRPKPTADVGATRWFASVPRADNWLHGIV